MILLPIESPGHVDDAIIVVLNDDSLARMAQADPAEIRCHDTGYNLVNPKILICHEKDTPELTRLLQTRDLEKIIKHLTRGFEFRPDKGDHDNGPRPLAGDN